ncbi:MAG: FecR domain-containing protein [Bacteroidales bacterium]|jgi:hypothetical protein|nr:FecR domain-containing protein [Bacteroidales bacterium]MCI1786238.1 FecR domain-containing protein [Bacteroidales bacterium]
MKTKELITSFLNGTLKEEEKDNLLAWIKASDENKQLFLKYYHIWEKDIKRQMNFNKTGGWHKFIEKIHYNKRKLHFPYFTKRKAIYITEIAASIAIIAATYFIFHIQSLSPKHTDILAFAHQTEPVTNNSNEVKLIVSKNKTVTFHTQSPALKYGNQIIRVNNEQIISEDKTSKYNQLFVPYGKRSTITLNDGTKVWVNAGTKLIYPTNFSKEKREIYIEGEAYLEVVHHDDWPFIVRTNEMRISVLGTKFDISSYTDSKEKGVVLVSGLVSIDHSGENTQIRPDHMYTLKEDSISVTSVNANKYISWVKGIYTFDSETLACIFDRLEKYYNIKIQCEPSAAELRCSGKLDLEQNFESLMKGLALTAPITYRHSGTNYIVELKN